MNMTFALEVLGIITLFVMIVDTCHELRIAKPRRMRLSRKLLAR
jgi:hypothetical protein